MTTTDEIQKHYLVVSHISQTTINLDGMDTVVYVISLKPTVPEDQVLTYATLSADELLKFPLGARVEVGFKITF